KFDVRNREERTVLNVEIDRDDVIRQAHTELGDRHVALVLLICVERGAVGKRDRQAGVVRARRADDVLTHLQIDHAVEILQRAEPLAVLRAGGGIDLCLVLEAHEVQQHYSSSPSMSSSPTWTTTLWISTRNDSRKVLRSRVGGHVSSFSVQAER